MAVAGQSHAGSWSLTAYPRSYRPVSTGEWPLDFRRIPSSRACAQMGASVIVCTRWSNGMKNRSGGQSGCLARPSVNITPSGRADRLGRARRIIAVSRLQGKLPSGPSFGRIKLIMLCSSILDWPKQRSSTPERLAASSVSHAAAILCVS